MTDEVSCRSDEGITVGIVDSMITSLRVFKGRDLKSQSIQDALLDIGDDPDLQYFLDAVEEAKGNRTDEGINRLLELAGLPTDDSKKLRIVENNVGHYRSIYKGSKSTGSGKSRLDQFDATMYAVKHAINALDMTQLLSQSTDMTEKMDLMDMITIAERKVEWWQRRTNQLDPVNSFDMDKFLTIFSAAKRGKPIVKDTPKAKEKPEPQPKKQEKRRKKHDKGWRAKQRQASYGFNPRNR